jgi:hypothetical protein
MEVAKEVKRCPQWQRPHLEHAQRHRSPVTQPHVAVLFASTTYKLMYSCVMGGERVNNRRRPLALEADYTVYYLTGAALTRTRSTLRGHLNSEASNHSESIKGTSIIP